MKYLTCTPVYRRDGGARTRTRDILYSTYVHERENGKRSSGPSDCFVFVFDFILEREKKKKHRKQSEYDIIRHRRPWSSRRGREIYVTRYRVGSSRGRTPVETPPGGHDAFSTRGTHTRHGVLSDARGRRSVGAVLDSRNIKNKQKGATGVFSLRTIPRPSVFRLFFPYLFWLDIN